jgi:tRNA U34 2-thiouridine synthase MnmA/TrmU
MKNNTIIVEFEEVQQTTPGQSCVIYDATVCIGGGIII